MTWFKVDDKLHSHPKWLGLSMAARGFWTTMGSWSSDQLTDGALPRHVVLLYGSEELAAELVAAGLWEEAPDGWRFHDWRDHNPTAAEVTSLRKKRAKAGSKGGKQNASKRQAKPKQVLGVCLSKTEAKPNPDPTRPDPSMEPPVSPPPGSSARTGSGKKRAGPMPSDFEPSEADRKLAERLALDLAAELADFRDWTTAKGKTYVDWSAAFRSHLRSAAQRRPPPGARAHAGVKGTEPRLPWGEGPSRTEQICMTEDRERRERAEERRLEAERQRQREALEAMG